MPFGAKKNMDLHCHLLKPPGQKNRNPVVIDSVYNQQEKIKHILLSSANGSSRCAGGGVGLSLDKRISHEQGAAPVGMDVAL